jgi:hypothetical protein
MLAITQTYTKIKVAEWGTLKNIFKIYVLGREQADMKSFLNCFLWKLICQSICFCLYNGNYFFMSVREMYFFKYATTFTSIYLYQLKQTIIITFNFSTFFLFKVHIPT